MYVYEYYADEQEVVAGKERSRDICFNLLPPWPGLRWMKVWTNGWIFWPTESTESAAYHCAFAFWMQLMLEQSAHLCSTFGAHDPPNPPFNEHLSLLMVLKKISCPHLFGSYDVLMLLQSANADITRCLKKKSINTVFMFLRALMPGSSVWACRNLCGPSVSSRTLLLLLAWALPLSLSFSAAHNHIQSITHACRRTKGGLSPRCRWGVVRCRKARPFSLH